MNQILPETPEADLAEPRAYAKCRRKKCSQPYALHVLPNRACPGDTRFVFSWRRSSSRRRASMSFSATETAVLDDVLRGLLRGADLRKLTVDNVRVLERIEEKAATMRRRVKGAK